MLGHRVKLGKINPAAERVVAIEGETAALLIEQAPAQRPLQQRDPLLRHQQRNFGCPQPLRRPARLDLPDPLDHKLIIGPMRAAVERQADPNRRRIIGRDVLP